jgi:hypothetical protein
MKYLDILKISAPIAVLLDKIYSPSACVINSKYTCYTNELTLDNMAKYYSEKLDYIGGVIHDECVVKREQHKKVFCYFSYGFYLLNACSLAYDNYKSKDNQKICLYSKNGKKITEFDYKQSSKVDLFCKVITFVLPLPLILNASDPDMFTTTLNFAVLLSTVAQVISAIYSLTYDNSKLLLELPEDNELYLVANEEDGTEITAVESIEIPL